MRPRFREAITSRRPMGILAGLAQSPFQLSDPFLQLHIQINRYFSTVIAN
jgi:hypothetical protein